MTLGSWPWGEMIASAIGGGGLAKLADYVFGGESRQVKALGDTISTLSNQLKAADTRQDLFSERLGVAEEKLERCEAKHAECEAQNRAVREELVQARVEIAQLMAGPVASYQPGDLRRPRVRRPKG
jgi:hypothetical protein